MVFSRGVLRVARRRIEERRGRFERALVILRDLHLTALQSRLRFHLLQGGAKIIIEAWGEEPGDARNDNLQRLSTMAADIACPLRHRLFEDGDEYINILAPDGKPVR